MQLLLRDSHVAPPRAYLHACTITARSRLPFSRPKSGATLMSLLDPTANGGLDHLRPRPGRSRPGPRGQPAPAARCGAAAPGPGAAWAPRCSARRTRGRTRRRRRRRSRRPAPRTWLRPGRRRRPRPPGLRRARSAGGSRGSSGRWGRRPTVDPYSGDMLPRVARSASVSAASPGPKNSTNLPTTPCCRSRSVIVSTRSVAVVPSGSRPTSLNPTTSGMSIEMGWPSIAASASMPPTPQADHADAVDFTFAAGQTTHPLTTWVNCGVAAGEKVKIAVTGITTPGRYAGRVIPDPTDVPDRRGPAPRRGPRRVRGARLRGSRHPARSPHRNLAVPAPAATASRKTQRQPNISTGTNPPPTGGEPFLSV